jgi:ADP-heptose:LPS heptosyltransferase
MRFRGRHVTTESILILQIGSLGDTVVSLPCYRAIARRHSSAALYLLTNLAIGGKMVSPEAVLQPTGIIAGTIEYPMPLRNFSKMIELWRRIVALAPTALYYLLPEKRLDRMVRHYCFFRLCGVRDIRGIPWARDSRVPRQLSQDRWESEASRLLRTIDVHGPPVDADRDLALSAAEIALAHRLLQPFQARFAVIAVGGKVPLKNWGDVNWGRMLQALSQAQPDLVAIFVGSADERPRNDILCQSWSGRSLNTCGQLTARETAAVISLASAFVGHDTGTLHLAAAANVPIVGVYSARDQPGKWFSDRDRDTFFYNRVACAGCELSEMTECRHGHVCMTSHDPIAVAAAVERSLLPAKRG